MDLITDRAAAGSGQADVSECQKVAGVHDFITNIGRGKTAVFFGVSSELRVFKGNVVHFYGYGSISEASCIPVQQMIDDIVRIQYMSGIL